MRVIQLATSAFLFALAACGQAAAPADSGEAAAVDNAAILGALNMALDANGQVTNECGDKVTPKIAAAEMGGAVGTAQLVAIEGGPTLYTCYGDGPDLHLMRQDGGNWREIYSARGRMLVILPTSTNDVHDIADGGPGFSFPVWTWNGTEYADAGRSISDAELGNSDVTYLP